MKQAIQINEEELQHYVHAAYCFARAIALPDVKWNDTWSAICLRDLTAYFRKSYDLDRAFITFCDRAIFGAVFANVHSTDDLDRWNCLVHPKGLFSNPDIEISVHKLKSLKRKNPFYQTGLPIMARAYVAYLRQPSARIVKEVQEQMTAMGYEEHMDLFHVAINAPVEC
jgi:hypothetical protein